ncbi:MAG TPA: hypothetical protein VF581_02585 [Flavobacterium sp.]|jgi:hypothetical protein
MAELEQLPRNCFRHCYILKGVPNLQSEYYFVDVDYGDLLLTHKVEVNHGASSIAMRLIIGDDDNNPHPTIFLYPTSVKNLFYGACEPCLQNNEKKSLLVCRFYKGGGLLDIDVYKGYYPTQPQTLETILQNT